MERHRADSNRRVRALQTRAYRSATVSGWSELRECGCKGVVDVSLEEDERDTLDLVELGQRAGSRSQPNPGGAVDRKAEGAGRDGRKRHRRATKTRCQFERAPVT